MTREFEIVKQRCMARGCGHKRMTIKKGRAYCSKCKIPSRRIVRREDEV